MIDSGLSELFAIELVCDGFSAWINWLRPSAVPVLLLLVVDAAGSPPEVPVWKWW